MFGTCRGEMNTDVILGTKTVKLMELRGVRFFIMWNALEHARLLGLFLFHVLNGFIVTKRRQLSASGSGGRSQKSH